MDSNADIPVPGTPSLWHRSVYEKGRPTEATVPRAAVGRDEVVDVTIIGGGFTGLSAARFLKQAHPELRIGKHACMVYVPSPAVSSRICCTACRESGRQWALGGVQVSDIRCPYP